MANNWMMWVVGGVIVLGIAWFVTSGGLSGVIGGQQDMMDTGMMGPDTDMVNM